MSVVCKQNTLHTFHQGMMCVTAAASKNPPPAVKPQEFVQSAPRAAKEAPKAAVQAAKQAAASAPSLPSAPAAPGADSSACLSSIPRRCQLLQRRAISPRATNRSLNFCAACAAAEGPSQTTILGAVAVVVAGGAAVAVAGKQGELPSTGDVQAFASQSAGAAKGAAKGESLAVVSRLLLATADALVGTCACAREPKPLVCAESCLAVAWRSFTFQRLAVQTPPARQSPQPSGRRSLQRRPRRRQGSLPQRQGSGSRTGGTSRHEHCTPGVPQ